MWRPDTIVKHTLPPGRWPTAEEARRSRLYSRVEIGSIPLAERTWVPAMVPWRASDEGYVTEHVLDWYRRFARGHPGAIVVEATGVRDIPSGPLLRIGHDRFIPGLAELARTVREASGGRTRVFIQIIDFLTIRRRPPKERYFRRYFRVTDHHREALRDIVDGGDEDIVDYLLAQSDEALDALLTPRELESLGYGYRERVTDTHRPHIAALPEVLPPIFAAAAGRAQEAGYDGVELHYAHAYTMASFLSALNDRDDGYGGPREQRVRLPLEVYRAVRDRVGGGFAVGCRFLSTDIIAGGSHLDDACYFGVELAGAGMDFLSLSRGGKFEDAKQPKVGWAVYPYTGRSGYECMPTIRSDERGPFGRNVPDVAVVRGAVRAAGFQTPIVVAGGIASFGQAEGILARGEADIIGAARQSLADPDWFRKVRLGRGDEVRRCAFTNYCEGLDQKHKKVTCKLWDRIDREAPGLSLSDDGRRRLVAPDWEE